MDEKNKAIFFAIKDKLFENEEFKKTYEKTYALLKTNPNLIKTLTDGGWELFQAMFVMELLLEEHENTKTEIYNELTIFTIKKDIN